MATLFYTSASFILAGLSLHLTTAENIAFHVRGGSVLLNDGNGFKSDYPGYFSAPVSGVYHFKVHFCQSSPTHLLLKKGYQLLESSTTIEACDSFTTIAKVQKNESVSLESQSLYGNYFPDDNIGYSFMGFLLYEI
ncbi:uncharacterized protein LOC128551229 [Mercenaria mercenaria]|uniref:uncharacterized protein LOC128551229 n=1 Tax=Mercenaria mercenaria TaxID=6596 RepID=UPI00234EC21C|nr:uncharacterized protein LOC128551229 [Mercenaria mercenaria]